MSLGANFPASFSATAAKLHKQHKLVDKCDGQLELTCALADAFVFHRVGASQNIPIGRPTILNAICMTCLTLIHSETLL